jgi:hypothetical protein
MGGHLSVFVRGTDNNLWSRTLGAGDGNDNWTPWTQFSVNGNMASAPSVTPYTNNAGQKYLQLVYRRNDNHVVQRHMLIADANNNTVTRPVWSAEYDQGGTVYDAPVGVSWENGSFYIFTRGTDNNMWVKTYWPATGWGGWFVFDTAKSMASGPTVVVRPSSRSGKPQMHLFWRRNGNSVAHAWYETSWNQDNLGATTYSVPGAMAAPY